MTTAPAPLAPVEYTGKHYVLTGTCRSSLGSVELVTGFLYQRGCYITELQTFDDTEERQFFIRAEFRGSSGDPDIELAALRDEFTGIASDYGMQWQIRDASRPTRCLIMVSKYDHCLQDLLHRQQTGHLNIEVAAIVSNHPDLKSLAAWYGIPYYHLPLNADSKPQQEAQLWHLIEQTDAELVILARYMQVLSEDLCRKLHGRAINIHHSLLPGFKGARPYHQAWEKGVKLVGATAHYVSEDLDEGPIISQGVEAVDHSYTPTKLANKGRDIERLTLAKAVKLHVEHRVFLVGSKTVVFPGHG
jgi:formyltetrahydrofolate deformylase